MSVAAAADLRRAAGRGLVWGAGFVLLRDVVQFATMLLLVRLLSPEAYGEAALAQTILLFVSVASLKSLAPYALAARDPAAFDWGGQFVAGALLNAAAFAVALALAAALAVAGMARVAAVFLVMALVLPLEILATHQFTVLQAFHRWRRMRLLLGAGAVAGSALSALLALAGAGVFALAVGNLAFALPLAADFVVDRARPPVRPLRLPRRAALGFAANRAAAGAVQAGAALAEQAILSRLFGFALLGIYARAVGLAQLTSGRIGPTVTQTLYPVLTRAEAGSERFRRFAHVLMAGVIFASLPAAAFLALEADTLVALLYGPKWAAVVPLIPFAAALVALRGTSLALRDLLLANLGQRAALRIDVVAAAALLGVALALPALGMEAFLFALIGHAGATTLVFAAAAARAGALAPRPLAAAAGAALAAALVASLAVLPLPPAGTDLPGLLLLFARGGVFGLVVLAVLRLLAGRTLALIVDALALPPRVRRVAGRILALSGAGR